MRQPLPEPATAHSLLERREKLRRAGKTIVLTNGCFDLLHPGHLFYLEKAAQLADELWVGVNSDESVQSLKGPLRPVAGERERAYSLSCLASVSEVFVFPNPRLTDEITLLKPDSYAKAGDYTLDSLNPEERAALEVIGASIHFIPFLEGFSTTALIGKIKNAF